MSRMSPWFAVEPVDATFFETAPVRLSETFQVARPAAEVWAELTADSPLGWCRILDEMRWTSPRPFGVGTTRYVRSMKGASALREYFFRWDEGRRKSFYVVQANAPLFRHFAEDYLVEPVLESSCAFTWTVTCELKPAARITAPVNKRILGTLLTDTRKHYTA
jgi:hypothetical protein